MMRLLDVVAAALGLLVLSPLLLLIALMIKRDSAGPVFYLGRRVGQHGRLFRLYKFRTMIAAADRMGPGITRANDERVTRVGRFLRHYKLDELPQLINVLKGEMNLVGPRPEDPRYVSNYSAEQRRLLRARPGITSPASLHFRREESLLKGSNWEQTYVEHILPRKLAMELAYLEERSLWRDLRLILLTIWRLASG